MFAAMEEALGRLYPTRRWGERDEVEALARGVPPGVGPALADGLASRLRTLTLYRPGGAEEWCDFVYVLCVGRTPSILEAREGLVPPDGAWHEAAHPDAGTGGEPSAGVGLDELHLRVALSAIAPFAAVQEVRFRMVRAGEDLLVTEAARTGVFDPVLLPRMQKIVAALAELDVRNLDFGDMTQPPLGFDPGDYEARFGGAPTVANYLFYPQPCASVTTTVMAAQPASSPTGSALHAPLESP
jgi:hypothetical protein